MTSIAAHISSPDGIISSLSKRKLVKILFKWGLSSIVKAYFDPSQAWYQSTESPDAGSEIDCVYFTFSTKYTKAFTWCLWLELDPWNFSSWNHSWMTFRNNEEQKEFQY